MPTALPQGFVLDQSQPALPSGFVLDQQPAPVAQPPRAPNAPAPGAGMVAGNIIGQMAAGANTVPASTAEVAQAAQTMANAPQSLAGLASAPGAFQTGAMQGVTGNFLDEIMAVGMTPIEMAMRGSMDVGGAYQSAYERNRNLTEASQASNPVAATAGNVVGAGILGGTMARGGASLMTGAQPTIASMTGRGAAEGALYGALYGAGAGESIEDRARQAGFGALVGGAGGAISGGIAGGMARGAGPQAPTTEQLRAQADDLYTQARNSGVMFPQDVVRTAADDIAAMAISEGLDPTLHPGATAALRRLQEVGAQGLTAQEAQTIRRVLNAARNSPTNPDQSRIAGLMVDMFDQQITGSIPQLAAANSIYGQARRGELIQGAFTRAQDRLGVSYNNAGMVTALRQEFNRILQSPKLSRGFSQAEIDAIRGFVRGGPVENFMRFVGRLAPTGPISGATAFGVPASIGYMLGNPVAGAAAGVGAAGLGVAARGIGNNIAMGQANRISEMVRSGIPAPAPLPPQIGSLSALSALQGQQLPQIPAYLLRSTAEQPAY